MNFYFDSFCKFVQTSVFHIFRCVIFIFIAPFCLKIKTCVLYFSCVIYYFDNPCKFVQAFNSVFHISVV